jgi:hypothetical protein
MTLRQKAFMDSTYRSRGLDAIRSWEHLGTRCGRDERHELGETGDLPGNDLEAPPGFEPGMELLQIQQRRESCCLVLVFGLSSSPVLARVRALLDYVWTTVPLFCATPQSGRLATRLDP